jgi:hypothetical protein
MKKDGVVMRQPPTKRVAYPDRSAEALNEEYQPAAANISNQPELEAVGQ